jgi:hypothetical protein
VTLVDTAIPLPGVSQILTITDWENVFLPAAGSGVIPSSGSGMAVSLDTIGRNAVINPGACVVRSFWRPVTTATGTAIPAPGTQSRIDRLVMRLDRSATLAANFVVPVVITGTPAASPHEPALVQTTDGLWDLPLASWTSAASGALTALKDERYFTAHIHSGLSTARPSLTGPGIFIETDTGAIALWTGTLWRYIVAPPDIWNPMAGLGGSGWDASLASYQRITLGGLDGVAFKGAITTPSAGSYDGVTAATLPAPYPSLVVNARRWPVVNRSDLSVTGYGVLGTDGTIEFQGLPASYNSNVVEINGTVWF